MTASTAEPGQPLDDLDIPALKATIPHRYPMLLVDRVTEMRAFQSAVGIKAVTYNEPFFIGHFPDRPIMPGVLIIEALAQTAAALSLTSLGGTDTGSIVLFMGIDNARFKRQVVPGDVLHLHVELQKRKMGIWRFGVAAKVDGQTVTQAEITARIAQESR